MSKIVYSGHVYESVHDAVVNNKVIWITYLREKYTDHKNLDNLYVSFVEIDKVGINPKTIWDTPVGVYSYPMSYVLKVGKVPFMGHENKATKVKRKGSLSRTFSVCSLGILRKMVCTTFRNLFRRKCLISPI